MDNIDSFCWGMGFIVFIEIVGWFVWSVLK